MQFFKNTTFTWFQLGLFKISIFFVGLALGAVYWDRVLPYVDALLLVAVPAALYVVYIWFFQHR